MDINYQDEQDEETTESSSSGGSNWKDLYENNKKLVWILAAVIIIVIIAIISSKGSGGVTVKEIEKVEAVNKELTVQVDSSDEIKFKIDEEVYNGVPESVEWASSDPSVATVDSNGRVTGKKIGKTKITGIYTHSNSKTYTFDVELTVFVGDETVNLEDASFGEGSVVINSMGEFDLGNQLILSPSNAFLYGIEYTSSNPNVVAIDENGRLSAKEEGEALITAIINDNIRAEINVYANADIIKSEILKIPEKIEFAEGELLKIKTDGDLKELTLVLTPSDSNSKGIKWRSSNPDTISVTDDGRVAALTEGTATITATAINGVEGKITVEGAISVVDVATIEVTPTTLSLEVGGSHILTPTVLPDDASNKALSFESSNPSVVAVQASGAMTSATLYAYKAGNAFITIKDSTGTVSTIVTVNVTDPNGNSNNNNNNGPSSDVTIAVRINKSSGSSGDTPAKVCDGSTLTYYSNPKITIDLHSGVKKIKYCYGTSICTPNTEFVRTGSNNSVAEFNISGSGLYVLRVQKFDSSGNEISSSESGNYVDGALEYYINTKATGTRCTRPTTTGGDGSTTAETAGCYVGTNSQGVGNNFSWINAGGTVGRNQARTVITTRANCTKAGNGQGFLCFKNGSTYCYGSYCSIRTGYTYLSTISSAENCGGAKPEATCPTITDTVVTCSSLAQCSTKVLTVTGQAQGGTLKYRYKTSEAGSYGNWSGTAPSRTEYGTTYVQVKVEGDSTHSDKDCGEYHITINQQTVTSTRVAIYFKVEGGIRAGLSTSRDFTGYVENNTNGVYSTSTGSSLIPSLVMRKDGYVFNGWYTARSGGSQVIDPNGLIKGVIGWSTSNGKWQVSTSTDKTLYAQYTQNQQNNPPANNPPSSTLTKPASPTISGGRVTKVYGHEDIILTCNTSTSYASGITKYYQFGESETSGGTPTWRGSPSTNNTFTVSKSAFLGTHYYKCRVYASNGSQTSETSSSTSYTPVELKRVKITFNANGGTINSSSNGIGYVQYGSSLLYQEATGDGRITIPTAEKSQSDFNGWWTSYGSTSSSNNIQIIRYENNRTVIVQGKSDWTDSSGKWAITDTNDHTLYAQYVSSQTPLTTLTCPQSPADQLFTNSTITISNPCPAHSTVSGTTSASSVETYSYTCTPDTGYTFNGTCNVQWKIVKPTLTKNDHTSGTTEIEIGDTETFRVTNQRNFIDIVATVKQGNSWFTTYFDITKTTNGTTATVTIKPKSNCPPGNYNLHIVEAASTGTYVEYSRYATYDIRVTSSIPVSSAEIHFPSGQGSPLLNGERYTLMQVDIQNNERYDIYLCVDEASSRAKTPVSASTGWAGGSVEMVYMRRNTCGRWSNSRYLDIHVPINNSTVCLSIGKNGQYSQDRCVTVAVENGVSKRKR